MSSAIGDDHVGDADTHAAAWSAAAGIDEPALNVQSAPSFTNQGTGIEASPRSAKDVQRARRELDWAAEHMNWTVARARAVAYRPSSWEMAAFTLAEQHYGHARRELLRMLDDDDRDA